MKQNVVSYRPKCTAVSAPLPLFVAPELTRLNAERMRLITALETMRKQRRRGAILRTEYRLQNVTTRILAISEGKDIGS
jgi:hypothetical protein